MPNDHRPKSSMTNSTGNWIGAGGFSGFALATLICGLINGSNMAGFAGLLIGVPLGIIGGAVGASIWKRKHRD